MAELEVQHTPVRISFSEGSETDKENTTPISGMKTVAKLGSTSFFSPFSEDGSSKYKKGFKIMSDDEIALVNSKGKSKTSKRRSLATLQPTTDGKGTLTGNGRKCLSIKEAFKRKKDTKNVMINLDVPTLPTINQDTITPSQKTDISVKTDSKIIENDEQLVKDALSLMKSTEKVDDSYWKTIAEDRRIALEETLVENEKLYDNIDRLEKENEFFKSQLTELDCYKLLYTELLVSTRSSKPS